MPRPASGGAGKAAPLQRAPVARACSGPLVSGGTPNHSLGCQSSFLQREAAGAPWWAGKAWATEEVGGHFCPAPSSALSTPHTLWGTRVLPQRGRGLGPLSCGGEHAGEELAGGAGSTAGPGRGPYSSGKSWEHEGKLKYECKMQKGETPRQAFA